MTVFKFEIFIPNAISEHLLYLHSDLLNDPQSI